ncbi:MAG: winged helix DNA-binding protein [Candidatus Nanohaloarchaea archaeon]
MGEDDTRVAEFFLNTKPSRMIMALRRQEKLNAKKISRKVETTYSHAVRVMNQLEEMGLVRSEKKGRKKNYVLTDKGTGISEALDDIVGAIQESRERLERDLD